MSKHFTTEGVEKVESDDGIQYISDRKAASLLGDDVMTLRRQAILDGNRDGHKYSALDEERGVEAIWLEADYIDQLCAARNKAQRNVVDLDTFFEMIKSPDTSEFADTYVSVTDLVLNPFTAQPVYTIMNDYSDQIVPQYPHDENSQGCITVAQYLDSLYNENTKRDSLMPQYALRLDEDHHLRGSEVIRFVGIDGLVARNRIVGRDLSGLLAKIESGDIRYVIDPTFGKYVRATDAVREMIALD